MARGRSIIVLALLLVACGDEGIPRAIEAQLKTALATRLKDPGSVQFQQLSLGRRADGSPSVVCGMLNAKNSYGAYTGFSPFVFMIGSGSVVIAGGAGLVGETNAMILKSFCPHLG